MATAFCIFNLNSAIVAGQDQVNPVQATSAQSTQSPQKRGFTMSCRPEFVADAAALGANLVRLMTKPKVNTNADGSVNYDIQHIISFLDAAKKADIGVVIDLHSVPNPQTANYRKDRNGRSADFWQDDSNLQLMLQFWRKIATVCKDRPQVIWYDLLNEPLDWNDFPSYPKLWPEWAQTLVDAIREIDPVHEIVVEPGPGGLCWGFKTFPLLKGDNIIYSTHNYQPHEYTHQGVNTLQNTDLAKLYLEKNLPWPGKYGDSGGGYWNAERLEKELEPAIEFQRRHQVRMYIGEFGVIRWAPNAADYLRDNLALYEKYGWDWTYHAFREFDGWSFEHVPDYNSKQKSSQPTAVRMVLDEYLKLNKQQKID